MLCSRTLASPALRLRFKPRNRGTCDKLHEFTSQTQRFLLNLKRKSFNFTRVLLFFSLMRAVAAPSTQQFSINTGVFSPYASWDSSGLPEPLLSGFPFLTLKSLVLYVFSLKNFVVHLLVYLGKSVCHQARLEVKGQHTKVCSLIIPCGSQAPGLAACDFIH